MYFLFFSGDVSLFHFKEIYRHFCISISSTAPNQSTNAAEQITCWEDCSGAASQEITHLLWNPKVHYCVRNRPPRAPIGNW
jgi:hypothetical protein